MKKKTLKLAAAEMLNKGNFIKFESREWNFYNSTLGITDTKLYKFKQTEKNPPKHICTIQVDNKTLEAIRLPEVYNTPDVISLLSFNVQTKKYNPTINYKLRKAICNIILNYKRAVDLIYTDKEVAFSLITDQCDRTRSNFCDSHHKQIITRDPRIIKSNKPREFY